MDASDQTYNEWRVLPIATLTSIATVIGSGILALPVTLYQTQLPVFIILFTFSMFAQLAVVCATIELLQRAREYRRNKPSLSSGYGGIDVESHQEQKPEVSLFCIAEYYLPNPILRYIYFAATFLCFISILVSYGLAGPQAVWQLVSSGDHTASPPSIMYIAYWAIGTTAVIFFIDQLLGVFGSFTVVKGVLFVAVVFIVAALPDSSKVTTLVDLFSDYSGWQYAAAPFLMSCVALGGVANTMPVTFNLLPLDATKGQVSRYRTSLIIAVIICYLLNIGWVLAVLQVVPRTAPEGSPSLTVAYESGQISTIPLISMLHQGGAVKGWVLSAVEGIVEMFIMVSTGVSFFVCAAGMKSFVDGAAGTIGVQYPVFRSGSLALIPRALAYILSFGSVLALVVANPDGFISVLTRFTSFSVNLQAGGLMFVMLYNSRRMVGNGMSLPFSSSDGGIDAGSSSDAEIFAALPKKSIENIMWEGSDEDAAAIRQPIALEMPSRLASNIIRLGSVFFAFACFLAVLGPLLGVHLDARE